MLYKLTRPEIESSIRIATRSPADVNLLERDIEEFVKSRLSDVVSEDQLMLIGQETPGQEEPDLLALDQDGSLYVFELKRWESQSENLLQVMRYAQIFGRYTYGELESLATRKLQLTDSLCEKHRAYFDLREPLPESEFNKDQVLVLITNGTDEDTISAVDFWSKKGVNVKCSPYRIYEIGGDLYIQFETFTTDNQVVPETSSKTFVVNTNSIDMPGAWQDMLSAAKAAAYYTKKNAIRRINGGSTVYLYHTGEGIIAKGKTTSAYRKGAVDEDGDEEYYVRLDLEWAIVDRSRWEAEAPKAWEINRELNAGHRFRHTVFEIDDRMAGAIDSLHNRKLEECLSP